ncbi:22498_t:CDS:2 [Gigaspora margarita]|uniref:AN1-type zinc finger protein 2A n=2 Tax=Gigaspora margarita TaxID=4874 RepID=A0A8H4ENQ6_GIGMA|nr:AN1-type zinc finger protein 2A [Gigaspora margarita]CAG8737325.1 22498_t:CDS:2 [Gigaspora margarita]
MELLNIGRHCANPDCKQLDYLPVKCQYCKKDFCSEHSKPIEHNCNEAPTGDGERVPICPLCDAPVPIKRGEDPNIRMDQHIANGCHPPAKTISTKPFNACSFGKCKERVAVRMMCSGCGKNYCIKHRLGPDHMCDKVKMDNKVNNISKLDITSRNSPIKAWVGKMFK